MSNSTRWIANRMRLGWIALLAGFLIVSLGILMEIGFSNLPYNLRIVTGLGILLLGAGAGTLLRYRAALKDAQAARRLTAEQRDERTLMIRTRAGSRAYYASAVLVYLGLMWASFALNGDLPPLAGDTLWFFLAACVILPFGVYVASILIDQRSF